MVAMELAWTVPIIIPFVIGLIVGFIVQRTFRLLFLVVTLAVVLFAFGYISITFHDVYDKALLILPAILGFRHVLPYSTTTFLLGLALGLWRG